MPYLVQAPLPSLQGIQCDDTFWITHNEVQSKPIPIKQKIDEKESEKWIAIRYNKKTEVFAEKTRLEEAIENLSSALQIPEETILYSRFRKKHSQFIQIFNTVEKQIEKIYILYSQFKQHIIDSPKTLKKNMASESELPYDTTNFTILVTLDTENKPVGFIQRKKLTAGISKEIYEGLNVKKDKLIALYRPTPLMNQRDNIDIAKIFQREISAVKKLKNLVSNIAGPDFCRLAEKSVFAIGDLYPCDLSHKIKKNEGVAEEFLIPWTGQILTIMSLFQKYQCAHLDVKPENILVGKDNKLHLCDLEFTNKFGKELPAPCGSFGYIAPENSLIINQNKLNFSDLETDSSPSENLLKVKMWAITEKADSWGTGCVLHEMCFGKPYTMKPVPLEKIKSTTQLSLNTTMNSQQLLVSTIAFNLLDPDPEKRHTVTQALEYFKEKTCKK